MNKFHIGFGGHPLTGDDFEYIQFANRDAIAGSLSYLRGQTADDLVVLNGCNVSVVGSNYTYTDGYIWYNGEVYYVPAQPVPQAMVVGGDHVFSIVSTNNATGIDTYQNGTIVNTWEDRTAVILHNTSGSNVYNAQILFKYVISQIVDQAALFAKLSDLTPFAQKSIDTWHVIGAGGQPAYGSTWGAIAGKDSRFIKDDVGGVSVRLNATTTGVAPGGVIFVLPVGYRPVTQVTMIVHKYNVSALPVAYVGAIDTAGNVTIVDGTNSPFFQAPAGSYLCEIYFKI